MKKTISILFILVLTIGMLPGCGGPDLTEVTKKYNQAATLFNEAAKLGNENGWQNNAEVLKTHNEAAETIEEIKATIEDPEKAKNIDVDAMNANLDKLITELQAYKEAVSVPAVPDLTEVTKKYNQAADIFNEATKLLNDNGWKDNAEVLSTHNETADAIEAIKATIEDPEKAQNIDVNAMNASLDKLITELQAYKEAVSVPAQ